MRWLARWLLDWNRSFPNATPKPPYSTDKRRQALELPRLEIEHHPHARAGCREPHFLVLPRSFPDKSACWPKLDRPPQRAPGRYAPALEREDGQPSASLCSATP